MTASVAARLERLDRDWAALFDSVASLDEAALNRAPAPGKWSIAQILAHVIHAERMSLRYCQKKTQDPSRVPAADWSAPLRLGLLVLALRSPLKVRAPEVVAVVPERAELPGLRCEREQMGRAWREFAASCPDPLAARAVYRHPFAGRLSLEQCVVTLQEHLRHHARQVARLAGAAGR